MMALRFGIVVGAAAVMLAACAQQPLKAPRSAPAGESVTAANASLPPPGGSNGITPQILQWARDDGYRPVVSNGNTVFCRKEVPVGSMLAVRHCVDVVRLRLEVLQERDQRQQLNQAKAVVGEPPGK